MTRLGFDGLKWRDLDAPEDRVTGAVFRGVDPKTRRLVTKAWGEQGAPTKNRKQRRAAQRAGDHARALKRQKED